MQGLGESQGHQEPWVSLPLLTGLPTVTSGHKPGASVSLVHQGRLSYKMGPKTVPLTIEPSASRPCERARACRQE